MAIEINFAGANIEGDRLTIKLPDGREESRAYPPPPETLDRLQAQLSEMSFDLIALTIYRLGGNTELIQGAKVSGDFEDPSAMVKVLVNNASV